MKRTRPFRRPKTDPGLAAAIQSVKTLTNLARLLGVTHVTISKWQRVPHLRVPEVSRLTGIPRHVLRPDLYEAPEPPKPKVREAA